MNRSFADVIALIRENNVELVNLRMADSDGQYHQVTIPALGFSIELIEKGINVDTTSYTCAANGDSMFIPDPDSAMVDADSIISTVVISGHLICFNNEDEAVVKATKRIQKASRVLGIFALVFGIVGVLGMLASWITGAVFGILAISTYSIPAAAMTFVTTGLIITTACQTVAIVCGIIGIILSKAGKKKRKKLGDPAGITLAGNILGGITLTMWIVPIVLTVVLAILVAVIYLILFLISYGIMSFMS